MNSNLRAFLEMLAWSEGTLAIPGSDNGYMVIVGSTPKSPKLLHDYSDHPRILVRLNEHLSSTAAGRYQILMRTYDSYKGILNLHDFSPASQDAIAIQLIRERHALSDVISGNITSAIQKVSNIWASLPGSKYGQPTHDLQKLLTVYLNSGGTYDQARPGQDATILGDTQP